MLQFWWAAGGLYLCICVFCFCICNCVFVFVSLRRQLCSSLAGQLVVCICVFVFLSLRRQLFWSFGEQLVVLRRVIRSWVTPLERFGGTSLVENYGTSFFLQKSFSSLTLFWMGFFFSSVPAAQAYYRITQK